MVWEGESEASKNPLASGSEPAYTEKVRKNWPLRGSRTLVMLSMDILTLCLCNVGGGEGVRDAYLCLKTGKTEAEK